MAHMSQGPWKGPLPEAKTVSKTKYLTNHLSRYQDVAAAGAKVATGGPGGGQQCRGGNARYSFN